MLKGGQGVSVPWNLFDGRLKVATTVLSHKVLSNCLYVLQYGAPQLTFNVIFQVRLSPYRFTSLVSLVAEKLFTNKVTPQGTKSRENLMA